MNSRESADKASAIRPKTASPTDGLDGGPIQRAKAKAEAQRSNAKIVLADSPDEAQKRFVSSRNLDPFPEIPPALLNSADIVDYVAATGLIHPFYPEKLKGASYPVRLLGDWVWVDENGDAKSGFLDQGQAFTLPRNSIVFMTTEPEFRLPDYIALRHNLKIDHVYKGLLVGTGPLVDPGFSGKLSLPIHNLTNHDYELIGGEEIIWVEVTKLSPNQTWDPSLKVSADRKGSYVPYPPEKSTRVVGDYIHEATKYLGVPSSSSAKIQKDARRAKKVAKDVQRSSRVVTLVGAATIVALVAGVLIPIEIQLVTTNQDLQKQLQEVKDQIRDLAPTTTPAPAPTNAPQP